MSRGRRRSWQLSIVHASWKPPGNQKHAKFVIDMSFITHEGAGPINMLVGS